MLAVHIAFSVLLVGLFVHTSVCLSICLSSSFLPVQAQKTQKPPQKPAPAIASAAPVVKDTLVKRPDVKPKQDTASTFQAFKRTEVKVIICI